MQGKGLLIASIVLLLLAGGVYWSNRAKRAELEKPAETNAKLITVSDAGAERLEIRRRDTAPTVLAKENKSWRITAPVALAADQDAVSSVVLAMTGLSWERLIEEKAGDLSAYGLNAPTLEVVLAARGKTQTLQFGEETPTATAVYAKLAGDNRVFTLPVSTRAALDKSVAELRDKRLLTLDTNKLTGVELTAKGTRTGLTKQGDRWGIVRPAPVRADGGAVEELIRKLGDARMDSSLSEEEQKAAPAAFAGGSRIAAVTVTAPEGAQNLEIRKRGEDYYARSSAVEGTFRVAADLGEALNKSVEDLRNRKVFDFGFAEPSRVEVLTPTAHYVFERKGGNWQSEGKQMDSTGVLNLVDKARDLSATSFPRGGFRTPEFDISVTSEDGRRVERVQITKSGNGYLAKREDGPALYGLDAAAVNDLVKAAAEVKPQPAGKK